jgi:hypothetical protein
MLAGPGVNPTESKYTASHHAMSVSGFDARQKIAEVGLQVRLIVRRRHAVDAQCSISCASGDKLRTSIHGRSGDAARSAPAQDVSSPDRLSIVVSCFVDRFAVELTPNFGDGRDQAAA